MIQSKRYFQMLQVSFLLSGACGLIYEIVWQRMLHLVFGSSVFATATVLTSFMAGLALGSHFFGKRADAWENPLRLYAYLEIGIGLFAVLLPFLLSGITGLYVGIHRLFPPSAFLSTPLKFLLCFVVLVVPTALMGGTLPAAVRFVTGDLEMVGKRVGRLYGLNTLGAVVGCVAAGYFLIVSLGARETTVLAALINCAIGAVILYALRKAEPAALKPETRRTTTGKRPKKTGSDEVSPSMSTLLLIAAGVSGFCALAYEVFWARALIFSILPSIYAFPTMLASFLCGSAIGSLTVTRFSERQGPSFVILASVQILIGISALATVWEFTAMFSLAKGLYALRHLNWLSERLVHLITAFSIMFIPSVFMGMVVPLISRLYTRRLAAVGKSVGNVYAVNTVGAVLGSLAAGFLLIPYLGITRGIIAVAALNTLMGGVLLLTGFTFRRKKTIRYFAVGTGIAFAAVAGLLITKQVPVMLHSLIYLVREQPEKLVFYKEGKGSTVSVTELKPDRYDNQRYKRIEVNGIVVAGESRQLRTTQKIQGHFPLLLYRASTGRDPRYVFQLGLGTGESAYSISLHNIKRVDCVEIAPAEEDANHLFEKINHGILSNPKFRLTIDDARNFLLTTETRYDIIENDSVHPEVNITTYTREYFTLARERLTESGILSSWIPLFSLSDDNLKMMMRTMQEVFPHVMVWYLPQYDNKHGLLMGSKGEMVIDYALLVEEMSRAPIKASLSEMRLDDPITVLSSFMIDENIIRDYAADALTNDDNHMYLPYYITRQTVRGDKTVPHILRTLKEISGSFSPHVVNYEHLSPGLKDDLAKGIEIRNLLIDAVIHRYEENYQETISDYNKALVLAPGDPRIAYLREEVRFHAHIHRGTSLMMRGEAARAGDAIRQAIRIKPDSAYLRNALGSILARMGQLSAAMREYKVAVEYVPDSAEFHHNLAMVYHQMGSLEKARQHCKRSLVLDPEYEIAQKLYEVLFADL